MTLPRQVMYHTDPPPQYEEFVHGAIPKQKQMLVRCPNCNTFQMIWTPLIAGVPCCPYCNCRYIVEASSAFHRQ